MPTLEEKIAIARSKAKTNASASPASSPASRYPHQRRVEAGPRPQCIAINRVNGKRCKRFTSKGKTKLCRLHLALTKQSPEFTAETLTQPPTTGPSRPDQFRKPSPTGHNPDPSPADTVKRGITTSVIRQAKAVTKMSATALVISQQSRSALAKLGQPYDPSAQHEDPKQVLLALVASAHQQSQVWSAMLASIPEADFDMIGVTPIPGNPASSKGTRIEAIQKFLDQATKTAARVSKMAIDAGIEERLVRLAEEQQALIADTIRAGLIAAFVDLVRVLHLTPAQEKEALDAALGGAAHHLERLAAGTPVEVVESVTAVAERHAKSAPRAARYRQRQKDKEGALVMSDDDDAESDLASGHSGAGGTARQVNPDYEDD